MSNGGSNKKVANSLVALSSAAVLSVYGAGYARTRAAADRIALQAAERRSHSRPSRHDADRPAKASAAQPLAPAAAPLVAEARVPEPVVPSPSSLPHGVTTEVAANAPTATAPRPVAAPRREAAADRRIDEPAAALSNSSPTDASPAKTDTPGANVEQSTTPAVPPTAAAPDKARYRDGTYFGWGTSRHGDIQAAVLVEEGRIVSATVAQCLTRYSCAWISPLPPRIVRDQGTTFDYVSGATESSDAFQDAVADALTHAQ